MKSLRLFPVLFLALAAWATPAAAQRPVGGGFSISGSGTVVTDYRFRGISQSNGDPALQATITLDHQSGLYAGAFGSTLSDDMRPGEIELDGFVGYTREIASGTDVDVGLQFYGFPNNGSITNASYFEPYASVRHTLGPVTGEIGAAYVPEQEAFGDNDSLHVFTDLRGGVPFTPLTIVGRIGYTSGPARFSGFGDYLDWRVGVQYVLGPATIGLDYVDNDLPSGPRTEATLVGSVRFGF
ncbi:MAG TPA: TorF family putative porin [Allosphingosinicella sp.]